MNTRFLVVSALAALVTCGCGQKDTSTQSTSAAAGPRVLEIPAGDAMKYAVTAIEAQPGADRQVILTNNGTQPREVMGHNWVLLKADTDVAAFDAAALGAKDTGYIPAAKSDEIIAHIDLLGPRKSGEADFKAPATPGG